MSGTDYEFSLKDVEDLAQKLDDASSQLTGRERALLLAIFRAARDHLIVIPAKAPEVKPTGANLREQILNAFIPDQDKGDGSYVIGTGISSARISPEPIKPPPIES